MVFERSASPVIKHEREKASYRLTLSYRGKRLGTALFMTRMTSLFFKRLELCCWFRYFFSVTGRCGELIEYFKSNLGWQNAEPVKTEFWFLLWYVPESLLVFACEYLAVTLVRIIRLLIHYSGHWNSTRYLF